MLQIFGCGNLLSAFNRNLLDISSRTVLVGKTVAAKLLSYLKSAKGYNDDLHFHDEGGTPVCLVTVSDVFILREDG
jgi:hypothetical protein